jgi:hypothetical protein
MSLASLGPNELQGKMRHWLHVRIEEEEQAQLGSSIKCVTAAAARKDSAMHSSSVQQRAASGLVAQAGS